MGLLNQLLECEFSYCKLLSELYNENGILRFFDKINPDYPTHNFTYISRDIPPKNLSNIIKSEIQRSLEEKSSFLKLVFDPFQPYPEDTNLYDFNYNRNQLYIYDLRKNSKSNIMNSIHFLNTDNFQIYLELEGKINSGKTDDQLQNWLEINKKNKNLKTLLVNLNEKIVGRSDLFFNDNLAKIEDIEILQNYRGKGLGKKLIKNSISLAIKHNKNFLYLMCNSDIGDYYIDQGFKLYTEFHTFIKYY